MNLNDIVIRTNIKPGDLGLITHLHGQLYFDEYGYELPFEVYVSKSVAELYEHYDARNNRIWICEHEGKMVGCMALMNRGAEAQLRYFLIAPAYRGIGLGKKLSTLFMDFMKQCNYKTAYLLTTKELFAAAHIYKQMGFQLDGETESYSFGKKVYEQHYSLKL